MQEKTEDRILSCLQKVCNSEDEGIYYFRLLEKMLNHINDYPNQEPKSRSGNLKDIIDKNFRK